MSTLLFGENQGRPETLPPHPLLSRSISKIQADGVLLTHWLTVHLHL